jgi:hypothetical protein
MELAQDRVKRRVWHYQTSSSVTTLLILKDNTHFREIETLSLYSLGEATLGSFKHLTTGPIAIRTMSSHCTLNSTEIEFRWLFYYFRTSCRVLRLCIYLSICGLFNDAVSSLDGSESNDVMINESRTERDMKGSCCSLV